MVFSFFQNKNQRFFLRASNHTFVLVMMISMNNFTTSTFICTAETTGSTGRVESPSPALLQYFHLIFSHFMKIFGRFPNEFWTIVVVY